MFKNRRKAIAKRILSAVLTIALMVSLCPSDMGYVMADEVTEKADGSIAFDVTEASVAVGGTLTKTATATDGAGDATVYESSNTGVATVDNSGVVTPVAAGTTTITATRPETDDYKEATASYTLTVTKGTQATLTWKKTTVPSNLTWQDVFENTVTGGTGNGAVTYTSSDTEVAEVDANTGIVTLKKPGNVTITATKAGGDLYEDVTASYTLNVKRVTKNVLSFEEPQPSLIYVGDTYKNEAICDNGEGSIIYNSGNTNIATVAQDGTITAVAEGTVTISATWTGTNLYNSENISYMITVANAAIKNTFTFQKGTSVPYMLVGETMTNPAVYGSGTVTYTASPTSVATVDSNGTVTAVGPGQVQITAQDSVQSIAYMLYVREGSQTVTFANGNSTVQNVTLGSTYTNAATAKTTVTYASSDSSVATVDANTGVVTPIKEGNVTITATAAEANGYLTASSSYVLRVNAKTQTVSFTETAATVTFNDNNNKYTNSATSTAANETGNTVTYSVESGNAEVNATSGEVTIKGAGEIIIKATYSGNDEYGSASATYTLTVKKASQTLSFGEAGYKVNVGAEFAAPNLSLSEKHGEGAVSYASSDTDVAEVNKDTGEITIKSKLGTTTITVTKEADDNYEAVTASYTLTVQKKGQTIAFPESSYTIWTGESFDAPQALVTSTEFTNEAIAYAIDQDENGIIIEIKADTGKVTLSGNVGTAKIKATKPGNENFDAATATYTLTVKQWSADDTMYTITDTTGLTGDVWFRGAVSIKAAEGYQIRLDGTDEWVTEKEIIDKDTDTIAKDISFYVKEKEHGYISAKVTESVKKDGTVPIVTIDCEGKTLWDKFLSIFGDDYNKEYKINSSDDTSGIKSVQYYIDEDNTVIKTVEQLDATTTWTDYDAVNFIDVAKGKKYVVYAKVTDNAGNYVYATTNGIVHDIAKPTVTFEATSEGSTYSDNSMEIYSDDIELTITVKDPDPYSGIKSVKWTVYNDTKEEVSGSYISEKTGDVKYAELEHTFKKKLELTKEVYTGDSIRVLVEVEDFSGHKTIDEKTYAISATQPSIEVTFDNNEVYQVKDEKGYFQEARKATVVITCSEKLFDEVEATKSIADAITAVNSWGADVSLDADMISDWVTDNSGMDSEDTHTATILFSKDANYTFDVSYTNKLNQVAKVTYVQGTKTPNSFAVDATAPTVTVAYTDGDSSPLINGEKGYFKGQRIAKITIEEATTFDAKDAKNSIIITAKDVAGDEVKNATTITDFAYENGMYTAEIIFGANEKDANYTFDIQYKDKAGNTDENVDMGSSITPYNFVVDRVAPEGKIQIGETGFWQNVVKVFEDMLEALGWYNSNKAETVTIISSDATSGVQSVDYFRTTNTTLMTVDELEGQGVNWNTYAGEVLEILPESKLMIYARIIDKSGHTTYLSTGGIVIDTNAPVLETLKPEITITAENGNDTIYTSDVAVSVNVKEPVVKDGDIEIYSGIKEIKYTVTNLGAPTLNESLKASDLVEDNSTSNQNEDNNYQFVKEATVNFVVEAAKNNSNSVVVEVEATDFAGNVAKETINLKIDLTAPQISVSYDNNDGDTSFSDTIYFNKARTATITIRENNFDPAKVSLNVSGGASALNWSSSADNANGDGGVHKASISFAADGDYTFGISCVDKVGHASSNVDYGSSLAPMKFTVDVTEPQVTVSYDNNNALNGNYYKDTRIATVQVKEHNFEVSRVQLGVTATDNGQQAELPSLSNWVSNGDTHTATIVYDKDALYTFDFDYTDKAGNKAADIPMDTFYVDKTAPSVSISNIVDESANSGEGNIGFSITATDTNFDVFTPVLTAVVKEGDKFVEKQISGGGFSNIGNGQVFTIRNVDADGIYRIACTVVDKAGNAYTEVSLQNKDGSTYVEQRSAADTLLTFSVNRQGSAYELDENTMEVVKQYYVQNVNDDVVLVEVNTNTLKEYKVTLNGKELKEGTDYTVTAEGGQGEWMKYIYAIEKSLFEAEGQYQVVVSSVDEADNNAFSDVKDATVTFVVDRTAPLVTVTGLESNGRYQVERQVVTIIPTDDGGALKSLLVRTVDENGKELVKLVDLSGDELTAALDENDGKITFEIEEGLYQNVQIICNDCAIDDEGNTNTYDMTFYQVSVSSSAVKMLFASKGMRYGIIGGSVLIIVGIALLVLRRKKKNK